MKRATSILFLLLVASLLPMSALALSPGHGNQEISQMPGFPIEIGPYQPSSFSRGTVLADLDGDGDLELIYVHHTCAAGNPVCGVAQVEAWDHTGNALPGFPVTIEANEDHPPSIGDLDGDGDQEIVVMTIEDFEYSLIYVIDHNGVVLDGYPLRLQQAYCFSTLFDLDLDGKKEILFIDTLGLQVIGTDGVLWDDGWPVNLMDVTDDWVSPLGGALSAGDVDNDGQPEIAVATARHSVVLVSANGEIEDGWPKFFPSNSGSNDTYSLLGDVDGDSDLEVIVVRNIDDEHKVELHVLHHDGEPLAGWPREIVPDSGIRYSVSAPIVADLDGDGGGLDVAVSVSGNPRATTGSYGKGTTIYALDSTGELKRGFPYRARPEYMTGAVQVITAVDIDGDGDMEMFADATHSTEESDGIDYGFLYGIDSAGKDLPGFPLRPAGSTKPNGAIFGDVDSDGDYEMAVLGMSFQGPEGLMLRLYLYDFQSSYSTTQMTWPTYHAANERSGLFKRRYKDWRFVQAGTRIGGGR